MSPVLRRLAVTLRRRPVDHEVLAAEAGAALLATCRDPRHDVALELLGRIDAALREHDHRLTTDLADDVARALRVECGRAERLVQQSEGFEAELIAVDEVLAKMGATPATDRVAAIRALVAPAYATRPAPPSRYGFDALDVWDGAVAPGGWVCDVCRLPVESEPCREHQPKAYAEMRAEVGDGPWCSADLDGAACALPAGHTEPCRPVEPAPALDPRGPVATTLTAQCDAHPFGIRCALVAGHPGRHTSAGMT